MKKNKTITPFELAFEIRKLIPYVDVDIYTKVEDPGFCAIMCRTTKLRVKENNGKSIQIIGVCLEKLSNADIFYDHIQDIYYSFFKQGVYIPMPSLESLYSLKNR